MTYPDTTYEETLYNRLDAEKTPRSAGPLDQTFYDALRRPVAMRDPLGRTTTLQWCTCGSLDKVIDPNGNATTWERDIQGRVTRETSADGATREWTHENTSSRVKQFKDSKDQTRAYEYSLDSALKQVTYTNAVVATPTVSLTHDPAYRRLATLTDGTGTTTFAYHPVTASQLGAGARASVDGPLAGDTDKISYSYDEIGQVVKREVNGTANVTSQSFDPLYRTTAETNALGSFGYTYQGATGRLASISYPNGQATSLDYLDNLGDRRLTEVHHRRAGGATLSKFNYDTSALGLITGSVHQVDAAEAIAYEYGRNSAGQLTAAVLKSTGVSPSILKSYTYGYDKAGNRTAEAIDTAVVSTSYNAANEVQQQQSGGVLRFAGTLNEPANVTIAGTSEPVSSTNRFEGTASVPSGASTVAVVATDAAGNVRTNTYLVGVAGEAKAFTHDANGNLVSDGTRSYEWDAEDRLVAVVQGTRRGEFTYNGLGQRVRIVEKDGAAILSDRRYIWSDLAVLEERDATGSSVLRRFFHQGVQEGTDAYFYTKDHLGSIREMTDAAGTLRARYDYDPYGRQTKLGGDKDAAFGFTGHFRHSPSGLELAPYRAYAPSLGRWISQDPIGFSTADLNLYSYVSNGPIDSYDPTGLIPAIALLFTPPGLAALTTAGQWTIFALTAIAAGVGLAEMTAVKDPPQALPPSTPTLPPPAIPPAIPNTPSAPAMPMSQPTPAPPLPVPIPTTPPTSCPSDPCKAIRDACAIQASGQFPGDSLRRLWVEEYKKCVKARSQGRCKP